MSTDTGGLLRARSALMRAASSAARVRRRRGIIAVRAGSAGGSEVGGGRSAVLGSNDGNNNRLPGFVVYVRPIRSRPNHRRVGQLRIAPAARATPKCFHQMVRPALTVEIRGMRGTQRPRNHMVDIAAVRGHATMGEPAEHVADPDELRQPR